MRVIRPVCLNEGDAVPSRSGCSPPRRLPKERRGLRAAGLATPGPRSLRLGSASGPNVCERSPAGQERLRRKCRIVRKNLVGRQSAARPGVQVIGAAAHPELLRDADRALVERVDDRDHRLQVQLSEGVAQRRARALGRQPASPRRARQAPSDLDGGQHRGQERRHGQADEAQAAVGVLARGRAPQPEAVLGPVRLDGVEQLRRCRRASTARRR